MHSLVITRTEVSPEPIIVGNCIASILWLQKPYESLRKKTSQTDITWESIWQKKHRVALLVTEPPHANSTTKQNSPICPSIHISIMCMWLGEPSLEKRLRVTVVNKCKRRNKLCMTCPCYRYFSSRRVPREGRRSLTRGTLGNSWLNLNISLKEILVQLLCLLKYQMEINNVVTCPICEIERGVVAFKEYEMCFLFHIWFKCFCVCFKVDIHRFSTRTIKLHKKTNW